MATILFEDWWTRQRQLRKQGKAWGSPRPIQRAVYCQRCNKKLYDGVLNGGRRHACKELWVESDAIYKVTRW